MRIPLTKPFMNEEIKRRVLRVLESGILTEGPVTREFEETCRDYLGVDYCIAVNSCTTGLEMSLRCLAIGPGDEVIIPDYTYPATADAVCIVGAKAVVVDIDPETLLIDYDELETAIGPKTRAAIPVSLFGNPVDYDRLGTIKKKYGVHVVEDAACSLGAEYRNNKTGTFADISVFSLHPRKFITTGEGGLLATNKNQWASWLDSYKKFGIGSTPDRNQTLFRDIGTNYKLSDVLSAIGLGQMQFVEELLSERRRLAEGYIELLKDVPDIRIPKVTPLGKHSYQSFCILVEPRDHLLKALRKKGIEAQIGTYCIHVQQAFQSLEFVRISGKMSGSLFAGSHCLALPLYPGMVSEDQVTVVNEIREFMRE